MTTSPHEWLTEEQLAELEVFVEEHPEVSSDSATTSALLAMAREAIRLRSAMVPRSRISAMEAEIVAAEEKVHAVQGNAKAEIDRLTAENARLREALMEVTEDPGPIGNIARDALEESK